MNTVLIVALDCTPYESVGSINNALRPAQFAKDLPALGWRAIVVCLDGKQIRTAQRKDIPAIIKEAEKTLASSDPTLSVIIPVPSLKYGGLIDRLWWSLLDKNEYDTLREKNKFAKLFRKPLTFLKFFTGDHSESWQPVAYEVSKMILENHKIDICIAGHSPGAGMYVVSKLYRKFKMPWIIDFQDPILVSVHGIARKVYRFISKKIVSTAKATINVTPVWAKMDAAHFNLPAFEITNGFDPDEFVNKDVYNTYLFIISYYGALKTHQDIEPFFRAFRKFADSLDNEKRRKILFLYRGPAHREMNERIVKYGVEQYSDIGGVVKRSEALELMTNSSMLILLAAAQHKTTNIYFSKGFYPGKLFEYLGAKRPIISTPRDYGLCDELIERTKTGQCCDTEEEILAYINSVFNYWYENKKLPYPEHPETERFERKNRTIKLAEIMDSFIKK